MSSWTTGQGDLGPELKAVCLALPSLRRPDQEGPSIPPGAKVRGGGWGVVVL